ILTFSFPQKLEIAFSSMTAKNINYYFKILLNYYKKIFLKLLTSMKKYAIIASCTCGEVSRHARFRLHYVSAFIFSVLFGSVLIN
ncbi:MAG: hypothetical protein K2G88_08450, partial [Oscillospiraceae bacterium]|nr:hypothetical protein [Oscillospiraceae bacterium]